jgi:hypothetical protein
MNNMHHAPSAKRSSAPLDWVPPSWNTVVLSNDPEDTVWGAAGLIGTQSRRGLPVTILSLGVCDETEDFSEGDLARHEALRRAIRNLDFGSIIQVVPVSLPNKSRIQQEVALLSEVWPLVFEDTLLITPRLDIVSSRTAALVCTTGLGNLNVGVAAYPPIHVADSEETPLRHDDVRIAMDAALWEAKRDALRCFAGDSHPVVDGPFDLRRTGRFARLHEEFSLASRSA